MKRMRWMLGVLVCMFLIAVAMVPPAAAADAPSMVVGRIYHVEGDLLRYVPEENDWVAVVRDAPFGAEDTLYSGGRGMAELIVPNGTWIRTGNSTQIQFIALDQDLSEVDVASGVARFYNKSSDTVVKVTSPFGYVIAYPDTIFDFYVGENAVEAVAIRGKVSFVHAATDARYDVSAGSPSILADQSQVSSGEGFADPEWNRWNATRENYWMAKARARGRSGEYLPPSLRDEAYALEENGMWERVPYEGSERWFWRPRVVVGWSPFTVGRWTDWYGDQTWIPAERFGYITHHYGNWIYVRNSWYWAPPVVSVRVGLPLLNVGFFWYPGRVSWVHRGAYVGWVPLAPREMYYSHRNWGGPHATVLTSINISRININVRNFAYANHAVVVNQNNFYRVNNYRDVRMTNINRTAIINNYRAAPVVNNTVISNYATSRQRYNYTNVPLTEKPHNTVINRIQKNQAIIREGRKEKTSVMQNRVQRLPEGRVSREARIEQPRVTNYIVPAREVNRPKSEVKLPQREIKAVGKPAQPGPPAARPERVAPARPAQPERPAQPARPERVIPAKPPQPEKAPPERVLPARPVQPEQARPERVVPARPAQPERVIPAKPAQPAPPAARPERVAPARPAQQERPAQPARPERVIPVKPAQPEKSPPERVLPAKPVQPEQARPERVAPVKPKETITPPARGAAERPKEPGPAQKQIEKAKEPRPSEKDPDEEEERLKK